MADQTQDQVIAAWREMLTALLDRYLSAQGAGLGKEGSQTTQAAVHEKAIQDYRAAKDQDQEINKISMPMGVQGLLAGSTGGPLGVAGAAMTSAVTSAERGFFDSDVYKYEQQRTYQTLEEYAAAAGAAGVSLSEDQLAQMHKFYKAQSELMSQNVEMAKMQAGMGPDTYYMTSSYLSRKALEWGRSISDAIDGIFLENQKVQDREINRGK